MQATTDKKCGCGCGGRKDCDCLMNERLRYFMGRHLTARDFCDEQAYHRSHRLFHNRMLHGWGVVCGLAVKPHPDPRCATDYVQLSPGVALDCCGREIVVECCASCEAERMPRIPWDQYNESHPLLVLSLCYHEEKIDQVAVLHSEGDCNDTRSAYGRVCEDWNLTWTWIARADLSKYGWTAPLSLRCGDVPALPVTPIPTPVGTPVPPLTVPGTPAPAPAATAGAPQLPAVPHPDVPDIPRIPLPKVPECPPDDCDDPCAEGYHGCAHPKCPPGHCIPIAVICPRPQQPIAPGQIVMHGRPHVPNVSTHLTRIVHTNWERGAIVTPAMLEKMDGTLVVTFSRRLKEAPPRMWPRAWGINEATFQVQFGDAYEDLDSVPAEKGWPKEGANRCTAEYKILRRQYHGEGYDYLVDHIVWITLKGNFIQDCHGFPIDGDGDHREGGTFESWFSVVSQELYDKLQQEGQL